MHFKKNPGPITDECISVSKSMLRKKETNRSMWTTVSWNQKKQKIIEKKVDP